MPPVTGPDGRVSYRGRYGIDQPRFQPLRADLGMRVRQFRPVSEASVWHAHLKDRSIMSLFDHRTGGLLRIRGRLLSAISAIVTAVALPMTAASPAAASPPTTSCALTHDARIIFWGVACTQPGEPVIGAFATWRNVPITFASTSTAGTTVSAANYLTMSPNTEAGPFANFIWWLPSAARCRVCRWHGASEGRRGHRR